MRQPASLSFNCDALTTVIVMPYKNGTATLYGGLKKINDALNVFDVQKIYIRLLDFMLNIVKHASLGPNKLNHETDFRTFDGFVSHYHCSTLIEILLSDNVPSPDKVCR